MNKPAIAAAAASILVLAACGKSDEGVSAKNASVDEVQEKVAAAAKSGEFMAPGQWKGSMKVTNLVFPEEEKMPAAMRDQMKAQMAKGHSFENCLTPEEARDPRKNLADNQGGQCTYDHFEMANGVIDAKMTCNAGGAKRVMTMNGTYSRDSYDMKMSARGDGSGPAAMSMDMEMSARRVGECKAGDS